MTAYVKSYFIRTAEIAGKSHQTATRRKYNVSFLVMSDTTYLSEKQAVGILFHLVATVYETHLSTALVDKVESALERNDPHTSAIVHIDVIYVVMAQRIVVRCADIMLYITVLAKNIKTVTFSSYPDVPYCPHEERIYGLKIPSCLSVKRRYDRCSQAAGGRHRTRRAGHYKFRPMYGRGCQ